MDAPPLPKKKQAVFHHPLGFELYDGLAMDLHAMTYAEPMLKEVERLRDENFALRQLAKPESRRIESEEAARYRWLRDVAEATDWEMFGYQDRDKRDAAIDAAMGDSDGHC